MWFILLGLISIAGSLVYSRIKTKRLLLVPVIIILIFINFLLLFYRISTPAHRYMPYFRYVYEKAKQTNEIQMYYERFNMYGPYGLRITFYRPANLVQFPLDEPDVAAQPLISNNLFFQRKALDDKYKRSIKSTAFRHKTWDMSVFQHTFSLPQKHYLDWNIYIVK
jgi:hypothetical protein